jgi:hypothetical protein
VAAFDLTESTKAGAKFDQKKQNGSILIKQRTKIYKTPSLYCCFKGITVSVMSLINCFPDKRKSSFCIAIFGN